MSRCKTADSRRPKYRRIYRRKEFRLGESIFVLDRNPIWTTPAPPERAVGWRPTDSTNESKRTRRCEAERCDQDVSVRQCRVISRRQRKEPEAPPEDQRAECFGSEKVFFYLTGTLYGRPPVPRGQMRTEGGFTLAFTKVLADLDQGVSDLFEFGLIHAGAIDLPSDYVSAPKSRTLETVYTRDRPCPVSSPHEKRAVPS